MASLFFQPIRTDAELAMRVKPYETTEDRHLDFKCAVQEHPEKNMEDISIDIAAFANAWGGTLLIGIKEKDISGVRTAESIVGCNYESDRKWIEQVIRNRVVPADVGVEIKNLNSGGKTVMAVNVAPDDRLVAAWNGPRQLHFPIRNNEGNAYMSPNEVVERASASSRTSQIKLIRAVEAIGRVQVCDGNVLMVSDCSVNLMSRVWAEKGTLGATVVERGVPVFHLDMIDGHQFCMQGNIKGFHTTPHALSLPFGLIREAWPTDAGVGLILRVDLRWTQNGWFLDQQDTWG